MDNDHKQTLMSCVTIIERKLIFHHSEVPLARMDNYGIFCIFYGSYNINYVVDYSDIAYFAVMVVYRATSERNFMSLFIACPSDFLSVQGSEPLQSYHISSGT